MRLYKNQFAVDRWTRASGIKLREDD